MISKFFPIIITLLLIQSNLKAQRFNTEKSEIPIVQLPKKPLDKTIETFSIKSSIPSTYEKYEVDGVIKQIELYINVSGLNKSEYGHILFTVDVGAWEIKDRELVTRKNEKKNKDGTTTSTLTYGYKYRYKYPIKVKCENVSADTVIFDYSIMHDGWENGLTSDSYNDQTKLNESWSQEQYLERARVRSQVFPGHGRFLESTYGYPNITEVEKFKTVKKFKNYDYSDYNNAVDKLIITLQSLPQKIDYLSDSDSLTLLSIIGSFKTIVDDVDLNNNKSRINSKVAIEAYYNMAIAYLYLNDFASIDLLLNNLSKAKFDRIGWFSEVRDRSNEREKVRKINGV